jgi:integrase
MANSSKLNKRKKHKKPYDGFPLSAHNGSGQWCKRHRGKIYYFGVLDYWRAALDKYDAEWPDIIQGRTVRIDAATEEYSIGDVCNRFMTSRLERMDNGELASSTFEDYMLTCKLIVDELGRNQIVSNLRSQDFARLRSVMAKRWGLVRLKNTIIRVRSVFKYALDERLVSQAVHYGQSFEIPAAKDLRKSKNAAGPQMFTTAELHCILNSAKPPIKAMVLLGLNCAFGNMDIATLPKTAIDRNGGWIEFPRSKTGVARRIPLWDETIAAFLESLAVRPSPKNESDAELCFLTRSRTPWVRMKPTKTDPKRFIRRDQIGTRFGQLLKELDINGRERLGFYTLRHVFETIAGESRDQVAVNAIMGHVDNSMAATYRERISDERLRAVVDTVHAWLWPPNS